MNLQKLTETFQKDSSKTLFTDLYGADHIEENQARYAHVAEEFVKEFETEEFEFFTSPGRTEIGGNHTDHNHGKILAGSINLDCVAAAQKNGTDTVNIISETYNQRFSVDINDLISEKTDGTLPLVKGIFAGFKKKGYDLGGVDIYITTNVISAAGVSSSASFEMLICSIMDYFFNEDKMDVVTYAHIGKYAENEYWKKQSGLLDQMACASGGVVTIDFKDSENPEIEQIDFSFNDIGYDLIITNTGKGHADLSAEYSAVPAEMKKIAEFFGKEVLADITREEVLENAAKLREYAGDRAVLRALHFFGDSERVAQEVAALKAGKYEEFLQMIADSGNSSWKWLQNCWSVQNLHEQPVPVALAMTELFIAEKGKGTCRVHGGGFGGVIMAVLPKELTQEYIGYIEKVTGEGSAYVMNVRKYGSVHLPL